MRRHRSSRRRFRRRVLKYTLWGILLSFFAVCLLITLPSLPSSPLLPPFSGQLREEGIPGSDSEGSRTHNGQPWFGLCKAYAAETIPGFLKEVGSSPVLSQHFKDFRWGRARVIRVEEDSQYYATYLVRGFIGWSKKVIVIHKGEILITDRKNINDETSGFLIRGFCCNQISLRLQVPELSLEAETIVIPIIPVIPVIPPAIPLIPGIPPGGAIPSTIVVGNSPPLVIVPADIPPSSTPWYPHREQHPPSHVAPVPEPSTSVLLSLGLGVFAFLKWRKWF